MENHRFHGSPVSQVSVVHIYTGIGKIVPREITTSNIAGGIILDG